MKRKVPSPAKRATRNRTTAKTLLVKPKASHIAKSLLHSNPRLARRELRYLSSKRYLPLFLERSARDNKIAAFQATNQQKKLSRSLWSWKGRSPTFAVVALHQTTFHLIRARIHHKNPQSRSNRRSCSAKPTTRSIKAMTISIKIKMKAASVITHLFLSKEIIAANSSPASKCREAGKGLHRCSIRWVEDLNREVFSSHLRINSTNFRIIRGSHHSIKISVITTSSFISSQYSNSIAEVHFRLNNCSSLPNRPKLPCHLLKTMPIRRISHSLSTWLKSFASSFWLEIAIEIIAVNTLIKLKSSLASISTGRVFVKRLAIASSNTKYWMSRKSKSSWSRTKNSLRKCSRIQGEQTFQITSSTIFKPRSSVSDKKLSQKMWWFLQIFLNLKNKSKAIKTIQRRI